MTDILTLAMRNALTRDDHKRECDCRHCKREREFRDNDVEPTPLDEYDF